MFSVLQWATHPDEENDDCITGEDYDTLEAAMRAFNANTYPSYVQFIELDGHPDTKPDQDNPIRKNPNYRYRNDDDMSERSERAMQAGMAFGVQGWNEEMGYD